MDELRKIIREQVQRLMIENEKTSSPIDTNKLIDYAQAIETLCNGEYGQVYYNEEENHVFVILGDSNPFDKDMLANEFMKGAIRKGGYENEKRINITIENESGPPGEGWKLIKKGKIMKEEEDFGGYKATPDAMGETLGDINPVKLADALVAAGVIKDDYTDLSGQKASSHLAFIISNTMKKIREDEITGI